MSIPKSETHLEQRFRRIWEAVAPELKLEGQKSQAIPGRRYVFDFYQPDSNVLIEIQGGTFAKGNSGHSSGKGIARDADKVNQAQWNGFNIMVLTNDKLTLEYITEVATYCRSLLA